MDGATGVSVAYATDHSEPQNVRRCACKRASQRLTPSDLLVCNNTDLKKQLTPLCAHILLQVIMIKLQRLQKRLAVCPVHASVQ